jgi:hypothetical protein
LQIQVLLLDKLHTTLDLTGKSVTVATATAGDNDTTVASTAFVSTAIANLAPLASPTFTGTLTASGLAYPTSDGTNGQVLTTNGSGTLSFSTISGYTDSDVETYLNTSEIYTDATNNRLGIGTASPDADLHVEGVTRTKYLRFQNLTDATSEVAGMYSSSGGGTNDLSIYASALSSTSSNIKFLTAPTNSATTTTLFLEGSSGNVGIGTTSPDSLLDVNGVINIKSNPVIDSDGTSHYLKTPSGGAMYFYHDSTNMMYYSSSALLPGADNARNLGSTSLRWANIFTTDLHLSNEGKPEGNEVDGTTGNWTIQEGEEHLYIINNKNGKKFKFSLEEIK